MCDWDGRDEATITDCDCIDWHPASGAGRPAIVLDHSATPRMDEKPVIAVVCEIVAGLFVGLALKALGDFILTIDNARAEF